MASSKTENFVIIAALGAFAYYAYRIIKSGFEPPPEEYVPDGVEAELYMDSNPDLYPGFQMQWNDE